MRQAMYQLQAAVQLKDRGFTLEAFQVPVVGAMTRITVPIAATAPGGEKTVVYTQSEEWTQDRVDDLRTWVANLREESEADVVVASRRPVPEGAREVEGVRWLHLPYDTLNEAAAPAPTPDAPQLLPCLKEPKWQGREHTVCRALWEREASAYMPWVAVGYDHPHTFQFINTDRLSELNTSEQALETEAVANLRARPAAWERVDVDVEGGTLRMLVCSGDFFAAERVLDPGFMQQAQRTLKSAGLFVGIPRRGLLMATAAEQEQHLIAAFGAAVAGQFSRGETAVISPMLFALKDGAIVGIVEAIADAVVPGAAPPGALNEEEQADDPDAPFVSAVVTRNDRGTEDVRLLAGGRSGPRLAKAIEDAFMVLIKRHMTRKEFSGHIQIVVLGMTPAPARRHIPDLVEHLRGICNDVSRNGERRYRVTLTFERDSPQTTSTAGPPAAVSAEPLTAAAADRAKPPNRWFRSIRWVMVLAGAAVGYFAISRHEPVQAYPNTIDFRGARLSQANTWNRGQTSGAVYLAAGEVLPAASLQVGVIVSSDHTTADDLQRWIREQSRSSQRFHDSGGRAERCIVGIQTLPGGDRTFMALQLCDADEGRGACVESDQVLENGVFGACLNDADCFDDVCRRRWLDERGALQALLAGFLDDAPGPVSSR